ncbi:hypothetical protein F2P56_015309 [Juglans regia]|uniref:Cyclic nucleotide-gated ion channel 1-like n=1 Tax=Juglans regia TaxID=51240 RepID=A0A833XFJ0_JUGRE|nr:hypothetical protein F2P56_015309 [Juglans regia]
MTCWQIACEKHTGCSQSSFSCDSSLRNYPFINDYCPIHETQNMISYDFRIFHEAIQLGILASTDIPRKMVHCFWWGLRNLSSFGQNLQTSARSLETLFAVSISISGLLLFLYFIGNLQMYMQVEKSIELDTVFRKKKIECQRD